MKTIKNIAVVLFVLWSVQSVFGGSYAVAPKGTICQALTEYVDANTISITAGYGECNGHYWESTSSITHDMTSLTTSEDFHYIYIDDANSDYPEPEIIDTTAEPAWSDEKLGWYNDNNRCIGVVWSPSSSAAIMQYGTNSLLQYWPIPEPFKRVLQNGNPTNSWIFLETTAYIPVNAVSVRVSASNTDWDDDLDVRVAPYDSVIAQAVCGGSNGWSSVFAWLTLPRNGTRDLQWLGQDNDDNIFYVAVIGYQIER